MVRGKASEIPVKPIEKRGRGRPPGSGKKAAPIKPSPESAPIGSNGLTDDQKRGLFLSESEGIPKLERLLDDLASANSAIRNHRKLMKANGFARAEIDYALWLRKKSETDAQERLQAHANAARWLAHPIGTQFTLFEDGVDRTPAIERAFEEGKTAGLEGKPCKPPHDAATEQGQKWIEGHRAGQAVLAKGLKTLLPPDDTERDLRPRFARGMPSAPPPDGGIEELPARI